ncbi:MAG: saccharopine dehydrogenase NADP-binding domain-containing protein [Stagnimonas sp.]|nr:saccharopine dehydrogenase NADP-binding domain-containing protein [Stagnimonas sp.]
MTDRQYDFVLFGATGFAGGLTAEYLARHAPRAARWALAGRDRRKLDAVRERLAAINPTCAALELLLADAADPAALARVARQSKVLITTVGPYALHGEPLLRACADAGTHYCDLTGEPEFVDAMWLKYQATAERTGAKLVHCCGFDSVPHDLGAYYTVLQLPTGVPLKLAGHVRASGGFSAGTYHSAINAFARARQYLKLNRERRLRETRPLQRRIGSLPARIRYDRALGSWVVPMPTIDPQIVKRSAAALDRYGPDFRYGHFLQIKQLSHVAALVGGVGALFAGAQFKLSREFLLARKSSGEGPSAQQREQGWFRVRFVGEGGGKRVVVDVKGGDPGYGETAKMLAESGLALAFDNLPPRAGQLTPVAAMGDALLVRLQRAGISFSLVEST